ncbi:hypothetical protein GCM10010433_43190 [Streptomyces pulveraceus]
MRPFVAADVPFDAPFTPTVTTEPVDIDATAPIVPTAPFRPVPSDEWDGTAAAAGQ